MTTLTSPWNLPLFGTSDPVAPLESNFNLISNGLNTALSAVFATVADLNALAALVGMQNGSTALIAEGLGTFTYNGTAWIQRSPATFSSASARDTAYAKASSAYLVAGAQVRRTDTLWTEQYFAASGVFAAGWFPVYGTLPAVTRQRNAGYSFTTTETVLDYDSPLIADPTGVIAYSAGSFTPSQSGLYEYDFTAEAGAGSTYVAIGANQPSVRQLSRQSLGQSGGSATGLRVHGVAAISAGQTITASILGGSTQTGVTFDGTWPATTGTLRYIGHA